ncbi:hypothetical protein TW95_gp0363 [Pandoravirus inopinatum]|uniref:Uncharacterized protein n=1 Tax=Pandoravirus inopinatum TaxID=1605721 RepID=A0A0B5JBY9_9VIRU|nr:hypothetical protein TW95_gp0363 [Pandoravirus inopinatum]AJF97097.1 hypothetical protein [Pandoravirus inopinatum]
MIWPGIFHASTNGRQQDKKGSRHRRSAAIFFSVYAFFFHVRPWPNACPSLALAWLYKSTYLKRGRRHRRQGSALCVCVFAFFPLGYAATVQHRTGNLFSPCSPKNLWHTLATGHNIVLVYAQKRRDKKANHKETKATKSGKKVRHWYGA